MAHVPPRETSPAAYSEGETDAFAGCFKADIINFLHFLLPLHLNYSAEVNLLCNGQECHSQAQCLNRKCVCNSGYQGDGVKCNGKYFLMRNLDNKCVPLSNRVTHVCNVPPLTFSFNFEPYLSLTTVF